MVFWCLYFLLSAPSYLSLTLSYLLSYPSSHLHPQPHHHHLLLPLLLLCHCHHHPLLPHLNKKTNGKPFYYIFFCFDIHLLFNLYGFINVIHYKLYYPPISGTGAHLFLGFQILTVVQSCPL